MARTVKLLCFLSLFVFLNVSLKAQDLKLAGFSVSNFTAAEIKDAPLDQEAGFTEYDFFLNLPVPLRKGKMILVNGLQYQLVSSSIDADDIPALDDQNLHRLGYSLTVIHELGNDWRFIGQANPVISSTLNTQLESDDLLFNGALQFVKFHSNTLNYGFGVARTARFGNPVFLPVLQFGLKTGNSSLHLVLPSIAYYKYQFGDLRAGFQFSADGSQYNANFADNDETEATEPIDALAYKRIMFGPTLEYRVGRLIQIEASAGFVASRSVEVRGDLFNDDTIEIKNSPFIQIGLSIMPPR